MDARSAAPVQKETEKANKDVCPFSTIKYKPINKNDRIPKTTPLASPTRASLATWLYEMAQAQLLQEDLSAQKERTQNYLYTAFCAKRLFGMLK